MEPLSTTDSTPLPPPSQVMPGTVVMPADMPTVTVASAALPPADHLAMRPWRWSAVGGFAAAALLIGTQMATVFGGGDRSSVLSWSSLAGAVLGIVSLLMWTWVVVENARRLLAPAMTQAPPSPTLIVSLWAPPLVVAVATGAVGVYLQRRLVDPSSDLDSPLPLAVVAVGLFATLMLAIRPLSAVSAALRRLGGSALPIARLVWVPVLLAGIGMLSIAAMRAGNVFGEEYEGIAPAWSVAVVLVLPVAVMIVAMWRGAIAAEDTIELGFDRRNGVARTGVRSRPSFAGRLLRAEAFPRLPRADSKPIRLLPGADALRLALFIGLIALCLVAVVGALVMVLFWRESRNGLLLPAQEERAWDVLTNLQILQRWLALGTLAVTTLWAFVSVLNARLATGRRRNPVLAAAAWPAAAYGIWFIADRIVGADMGVVVLGFVAQAAVFAVPFVLLERAAIAVHAHRAPLRLSYGLGVVLLVLNQGLFGLATLERSSEVNDFGAVAGSLAVAALLQLVASLSVTESSRLIADGAADLAADHNILVERQRMIAATDRVVAPDSSTQSTGAVPGSAPVAAPMTAPTGVGHGHDAQVG